MISAMPTRHSTIPSVLILSNKCCKDNKYVSMKKIIYMAGVALAAMAISSCDENTNGVGQSLTKETDKLVITEQEFTVSTRTVVADSVFTLGTNSYLGKVRDPETMADVTSEFATQFNLLDNIRFHADSQISSRYEGKASADSCDLILYLSSPYNAADSLSAIKLRVHELKTTMEEGVKYYSNFNPLKLGLVRTDGLDKTHMFTYRNQLDPDSSRAKSSYLNNIRISLEGSYTATDGTVYNNYGTYLMRMYHEHPEYYRNSYTFCHKVCPGFFFEIANGYGFHARVTDIGLRVFYRIKNDTTEAKKNVILAATKEVLQTTLVSNNMKVIRDLANETSHTYIKSPAGLFTEVTLPVKEIKQNHLSDSLIAARISFQRINNESFDSRTLSIPQTLLMIQKDSLSSFFEANKLPDDALTYYCNYNYVGSSYKNINSYTFTNISHLITALWNIRQNGVAQNPSWEAEHPNWNKVLLVPVTYNGSSSTSVEHDLSLTSTRLVGGPNNPNEPVKLKIVYGKFND